MSHFTPAKKINMHERISPNAWVYMQAPLSVASYYGSQGLWIGAMRSQSLQKRSPPTISYILAQQAPEEPARSKGTLGQMFLHCVQGQHANQQLSQVEQIGQRMSSLKRMFNLSMGHHCSIIEWVTAEIEEQG